MRPRVVAAWMIAAALGAVRPAGADELTPHAFLQQLCDDFGGRLTGSTANAQALARLAAELRTLGYAPERQEFSMPGWERGEDRVTLLAPLARPLRVAALNGTEAHAPFEAEVVGIGNGRPEDFPVGEAAVRGRVGVLASGSPRQVTEVVAEAQRRGLRGVLFVNREGGGQLLARSGGFLGGPLAVPVYSITQEEGRWLERLLARGVPVRVRLETHSRCRTVETANLRVTIPGRTPGRIVVGAHFDSWDLGQGAMDNGLGVAQLLALARALRGATPRHTVELIWFNGEEQGLFGSRHAAAQLGETPVVAMVNLDMVGVPIGVNALGDASLVPALERWHAARGEAKRLPKGVENMNWVASDHTPYQLAGVRCVTFNAPIPRESVRYYHDLADTIDKVSPAVVDDSAAVIVDLVRALADDATLGPWRRPRTETEKLFTATGLDRRLRANGVWPFSP